MDGLVLVQFTKSSPPYCSGETAAFLPEEAAALIEARVAAPADGPARLGTAGPELGPEPDEVVLVRFTRYHPPYCAGETAAFSPVLAADLVERGIARFAKERLVLPAKGPDEDEPEDQVRVRFLKAHSPYAKGDVASFPLSQARGLIKRRVAEDAEDGEEAPAHQDDVPAPVVPADEPPAGSVDPGVNVLGLDDRKPDWREEQKAAAGKGLEAPPADKIVRRPPRTKGGGSGSKKGSRKG